LIDSTGDLQVVGQASDGEQGVAAALDCTPDVILMDLSMPVMDGVEATRKVLAALPETKIVVLTSFSDRAQVDRALQAGAIGYVLKDCDPQDLVAAVRSAAAGHAPIDPRVARALLPSAKAGSPVDQLSSREVEVLRLIGKGMANKQIGRALGIQENTVKAHVGSIFRAIGVTDRTSAALWARENLPEE
jgi:DNA-binding NarL/FixJ family response regulator